MGGGGANSLISPTIGEKTPEYDEEYVVTYKEAEDWFIDFQVSDKIAQTTILGNGSQSSPYVLNSLEDLLFITRQSSLYEKYIKINCDIVLNDEQFDENGIPYGGDGIVYNWCGFVNAYFAHFDFCGHAIKGLYINKPDTTECISFINTSNTIAAFNNAVFENVYLNGQDNVSTIGYTVRYCQNVVVKNGNLYGTNTVSGVCRQTIQMQNVTNYANIVLSGNKQYASGIVATGGMTSLIKNCTNYGNISGYYYTSGIIGDIYNAAQVINCKNYGHISGRSLNISGIVAVLRSANTTKKIINCENYGSISGSGNRAGILSYCDGSVDIIKCKNYGHVFSGGGTSTGDFIGRIATVKVEFKVHINIVDCETYAKGGHAFFGYTAREGSAFNENFSMNIIRCKYYSLGDKVDYPISSDIKHNFILRIEDSYFYVKNYSGEKLIKDIGKDAFVCISNTLFEFESSDEKIQFTLPTKTNIKLESVIANVKNINKCFYGSDFSDFYIDYKTGKIGLKAFSGKGFYQGKVTEQYLLDNGYTKKAIV